MRKTVKHLFAKSGNAGSIEWLDAGSCSLNFDFHGREGEIRVTRGSRVKPFQLIAVSKNEYLHSPFAWTIAEIDSAQGSLRRIVIRSDSNPSPGEMFTPFIALAGVFLSIGGV